MTEKVESTSMLPKHCIDARNILSEELRNSEILDEIVLEIYNGWPGRTGEERVINCIEFISNRIPQYAKATDKTEVEFLTLFAKSRRVNYTNWFQNANLPDLSDVFIFDSVEDYKKRFPSGKFICPSCDGETTDYQSCNSGKKMKKSKQICDWKVYGLFGDLGKGIRVLVKDQITDFPKPIHMFRPIELPEPEKKPEAVTATNDLPF